MSENYIQKITMECLINKDFYEKTKYTELEKQRNAKDTKFYKKRIVQITKDILNKEPPDHLLPDVVKTFHTFVNNCILYFKTIDKCDILQEDYKGINMELLEGLTATNENIANYQQEETDKQMMRTIKVKKPSLDTFVVKKTKKPEEQHMIPQKKNLNLKDPLFKIKGVKETKCLKETKDEKQKLGKKENMNIIYENEKNNEKQEKQEKLHQTKKSKNPKKTVSIDINEEIKL